ncbi:hypothetical protein DD237_000217 [Peronospora effusa]|uniref:Uncharacterized protein n=1 Tax=Peronospora effusa TaxID=542832 RepID=A0A3R7WPK8_9STRA|nr:hypothetical protein DD237_000217 [Peronospora effusa]
MLLECQDVVSKSYSRPFNAQSLLMRRISDPPRRSVSDFRSNTDTHSWLQRAHIQRDEAEPTRRATRGWKNRNLQPFKTRSSASAMVLARKCKRNEERKLLNGKKQSMDCRDGSENNRGDEERESLDMEEQLAAFVEYDATDMDNLEINPSQDFDGDEEEDAATQVSQHIQSSSWKDVTDVDQYQDEASECFDNVIYAPQSASIPRAGSTYIQEKRDISHPVLLKKAMAIPDHDPLSDDSEGSLSDGFDIAVNLTSAVQPALQPATMSMHANSTSPNVVSKVRALCEQLRYVDAHECLFDVVCSWQTQWRQRRSVKRDCSLIDNSSNYSVNGRLLLAAPSTPATTSESSSDRVIELKDGCFDSSDDVYKVSMWHNKLSCSVSSSLPETTTTVSSSLNDPSSVPISFQSRLARKRRKVGQLTLDGFFRPKKD